MGGKHASAGSQMKPDSSTRQRRLHVIRSLASRKETPNCGPQGLGWRVLCQGVWCFVKHVQASVMITSHDTPSQQPRSQADVEAMKLPSSPVSGKT